MTNVQLIKVLSEEAGWRLNHYFKKKFPKVPHSLIEKLCRKGNIRVDGKRVKSNFILKEGQELRIPPLEKKATLQKPKYHLTSKDKDFLRALILYEDEFLYVLNKPSGLAVQGGTKTHRHLDVMLQTLKSKTVHPHLVHRLDKDTSGVMIVAKSREVAQWLMTVFKDKQIKKTYLAFVVGIPKEKQGAIKLSILKQLSGNKEKMMVASEGKSAVTHYKVKSSYGNKYSYLELSPETGRTHQLRVHCAEMGWPILGDGKYGGKASQPFPDRLKLCLHASSIQIPYPSAETKIFKAPLPSHFEEVEKVLKNC